MKTILVVDDDPDFLFQQEMILKNAGYEVLSASNRKAAETIIAEKDLDAVIVDLMMEENDDGFVLCHFVKKKDKNLPVILVTGVASETGIEFDASTAEERSWIKADMLLAKPVQPGKLLHELKRLMKEE